MLTIVNEIDDLHTKNVEDEVSIKGALSRHMLWKFGLGKVPNSLRVLSIIILLINNNVFLFHIVNKPDALNCSISPPASITACSAIRVSLFFFSRASCSLLALVFELPLGATLLRIL